MKTRSAPIRIAIQCHGPVQGIGLRPQIKRLAQQHQLAGWVRNCRHGLEMEVEGEPSQVEALLEYLRIRHADPNNYFTMDFFTMDKQAHQALFEPQFQIRESNHSASNHVPFIPLDKALCELCQQELFDPNNRRYRYPFISCAQCGPRYAITTALPFDRRQTAMAPFPLCDNCQQEYDNIDDRRHHAQAISCPQCGPKLKLLDGHTGAEITRGPSPWQQCERRLKQGGVGVVKSLSGYQLVALANDASALQRLRKLKNRSHKPFALMYPSLEKLQQQLTVLAEEKQLLQSAASPLVLLRTPSPELAQDLTGVAPGLLNYMVMLPGNGIYQLLLHQLDQAIVVTSCNLGGDPIASTLEEVKRNFVGAVDFILHHNLEIINPQDDSITQTFNGRTMLLRPGRGYSPQNIRLSGDLEPTLATGAWLKNTVALAQGKTAILSQYIGDLGNQNILRRQRHIINNLSQLSGIQPQHTLQDINQPGEGINIAHHSAHAKAALQQLEQHIPRPAPSKHAATTPRRNLVLAWDGIGLDENQQILGSECFLAQRGQLTPCARLRPFPLPGADRASLEPRRVAFALLWQIYGQDAVALLQDIIGEEAFSHQEYQVLSHMLTNQFNSPMCSSMGRLFDGCASLLNICQLNRYQAEAAIRLQQYADACNSEPDLSQRQNRALALNLIPTDTGIELDWQPLIQYLIRQRNCLSKNKLAMMLHRALAQTVMDLAQHLNTPSLVVSGGCWQNRILLEQLSILSRRQHLQLHVSETIPVNDSGIALGQLLQFANQKETTPCV